MFCRIFSFSCTIFSFEYANNFQSQRDTAESTSLHVSYAITNNATESTFVVKEPERIWRLCNFGVGEDSERRVVK